MPLKPKAEAPAAAPVTSEPRKLEAPKAPVRSEVRGQVAMHAIIAGYKVASQLAATLAASPDKVKEALHTLAAEVASKIEAHTFRD